jgi:hypothetical protein
MRGIGGVPVLQTRPYSDRAPEHYVPLHEAKMTHQFDHRWTTYDGTNSRDGTAPEKLTLALNRSRATLSATFQSEPSLTSQRACLTGVS